MRKTIHFTRAMATEMAAYLAELERQGIVYETETDHNGWYITITGH